MISRRRVMQIIKLIILIDKGLKYQGLLFLEFNIEMKLGEQLI